MKDAAIFALCAFTGLQAAAVGFDGVQDTPVVVSVGASTGLEAVYVLSSTVGVSMAYEAAGPTETVRWYRFSNLGGAYAEEIATDRQGARVTAQASEGDMGYIIEEGSKRTCFWVCDYSRHMLNLATIAPAPEQNCGTAILEFAGEAGEIPFYSINGRRQNLSRELELEYTSLSFDEETFVYNMSAETCGFESVGSVINVTAPLCDTSFRLSGDRFLEAWGRGQSIDSPMLTATTVEAHTRATQQQRDVDNEQSSDAGSETSLGGSAPCEITFEAAVTDAAIYHEWQISRDPEFGIIENTFSELSFDYTFRENGTTYVRFIANNAEGTCEYIGNTFEVFIGESKLEIPNAFSPEESPGVNDEWKVSYRSIVSFECSIFNRWGRLLFSTTDPSQGWDGKHGGKYVPAGVYFYVIKAKGADGVEYNKAGDINIIKFKQGSSTGGSSTTPTE
ncbi:MAG: gliding motility-associated C-terminal domain-containing protein [Muribaculaceae bacterium]|nr:gliding motility-associated C-terminal domain-containing protein [Muribaculaceae bacterium]